MALQTPFDTFTFSGDHLARARQALEVARHLVRVAQSAAGSYTADALSEIEDVIGDHLGQLSGAIENDACAAEESGEADRERRSWFPTHTAA